MSLKKLLNLWNHNTAVKQDDALKLEKIMEFWNFPRLSIDLNNQECNIAETKIDSKKVLINSEKIKQELGEEHLETIISQQLGKIALCPFDIKTKIIHDYLALNITRNKETAQAISNIFSDIIANNYIAENGDKKKLVDLLKTTIPQESDAQKLYLRFYEKLFKLPDKTLVDKVDNKIENSANSLSGLFRGNIYNHETWKDMLQKFTKIFSKYIEEMQDSENGDGKDDHKSIQEQFGSSSVEYDKDSKETQQALKEIAQEMQKEEFKQLVAGLELGKEQFADIIFYRAKSQQYKIQLPKIIMRSGETFPISPKTWNPEDDPLVLDVNYSMGRHGIIIPGITTYQWQYQELEGFKLNFNRPDLLIVLDSSGSMTNPFEQLSLAVLSAMTAKRSALDQGCKVGVVNFSAQHKTVQYTQEENDLDKVITTYYGGGTVLPSQEILKLVKSNKNKQHIIIISDACISDFGNVLLSLEEACNLAQSGGSLFLIGNNDPNVKKAFEKIGYNVHFINQEQELLNLVLEDVKKVYEA